MTAGQQVQQLHDRAANQVYEGALTAVIGRGHAAGRGVGVRDVEVLTPLLHIAVCIVQAPGIGGELRHCQVLDIVAGGSTRIPRHLLVLPIWVVVAGVEVCGRTRTREVFPFDL